MFKINLNKNVNMFESNVEYFKPKLRLRLNTEVELENKIFYKINK